MWRFDNPTEAEDQNSASTEEQPEEQSGAAAEPSPPPEKDEAYRDRWMRAMADLENLRKRKTREIQAAQRAEREAVLCKFLAVMDNFDRALAAADGEAGPWIEGIKATHDQMLEVLRQFGAERIEALGQRFDPNIHEAVGVQSTDEHPEGTIVQVTQGGYQMENGGLLRPAQVIVAREPERSEDANSGS